MTEKIPPRPRTRLYLITPPHIAEPILFRDTLLDALLTGGDIAALQVRQKDGAVTNLARTDALTRLLLPALRERGIAVFVNDDPALARDLGADGVHLGAEDMPVKAARKLLGPDMLIGATARNSYHAAMQAGEDGADYVAFGAFFPSQTKTDTRAAELDLLEAWQAAMTLPCAAIGGITPENAAPLVTAGADFLAVCASVFSVPGPGDQIAAFNALLDQLDPGSHQKRAPE